MVVQTKIEFPVWLSWVTAELIATEGNMPSILTHLQGNVTRARRSPAEKSLPQQQDPGGSGTWPAWAAAEIQGNREEKATPFPGVSLRPGQRQARDRLEPYMAPENLTGCSGLGIP